MGDSMFIPVMSVHIHFVNSSIIEYIKFDRNRSNKIEIHCKTRNGEWLEINTGRFITDINDAYIWFEENLCTHG
jgi:hypothetical protein